ncbi:CDCA2 protein, partial [Grantiella picta]|nr:CDCA2 protein [Grantiella picta]
TASKKPLLSPIPEIPEVFSAVSTPNSPKADALSTGGAALANPTPSSIPQEAEAGRSRGKKLRAAAVCPSLGDTEVTAATSSGAGDSEGSGSMDSAPQFSNIVPDAESDFDTSEYFQRGEDTPHEQEAKESSSLIENQEFQGNLLTGLEILTQHHRQEAAQRAEHPAQHPASSDPPRRQRRRSSSFRLPPAENLEVTGVDLAVSSYSVEEILSIPRGRQEESQGFPQGSRRRSTALAELRVRRSMRLSRDAASEGLAWVELPSEIPKEFPPAAPPKGRRGSSTSILAGAENVHPKKQSLSPLPAPGKENESSAALAAAPGRGRRGRNICGASARAEPAWAPTQRRRSTSSGWGKDRRHQNHPEETETLELRVKEVPGLSDFLK